MERLVTFFLRNPVLVKVIVILAFAMGIKTMIEMPKEGFPNVALNKAVISTIYPGASARDVEYNVTMAIEDELKEVDGIDEISSVSKESMSIITIEVDENEDEAFFNEIYNQISQALDRVDDLPKTIKGRPKLEKVTSFDRPIVEIAITGEYSKAKAFAKILENRFVSLSEISGAELIGVPDDEVNIIIDSDKAKKLYIDLPSIVNAIQLRNVEGSGGTLILDGVEKKVVSLTKYQNLQDVLDTNIRINEDGSGVKLSDVGEVFITPEDVKLHVRNNGREGISLLLKKKRGADVVKTMSKVERILGQIDAPKGVRATLLNDQSRFTRNRLMIMGSNALIGVILVAFILFITFDFRMAFWVSFGIPFSLMVAYIFFPMLGQTLNAISLGGFIIMVGIVVDDAIVIGEKIRSNQEEGMDPFEASSQAVVVMWRPVLTATLTTIMAFSPLFSFGGLPGKFIWVMPLLVMLILTASLFEGYFLLPSHLLGKHRGRVSKKPFIHFLEEKYKRAIAVAIRFRFVTIAIFIALLLSSVIVAKNFLKKDTFPQNAAEGLMATITLPVGITESKAIEATKKYEALIQALPKEELIGFSSRIGTHSANSTTERGTQYNLVQIFIYLTPFEERDRDAYQILDDLRHRSKSLNHSKVTFDVQRIGPPLGNNFEINVLSKSDDLRLESVENLKKYISNIEGVVSIDDDYVQGNEEYNVVIDYDQLARVGLSVRDVVTTLRIAFDGLIVTDSVTDDGLIDYRVRLNKKFRTSHDFVKKLPVLNRHGRMIELKNVLAIVPQKSQGEIRHLDGVRSTMVYGTVNKKITSGDAIHKAVSEKFRGSTDVYYRFSGEPVEGGKIFKDVKLGALMAIIGVYLIIALMFGSFKLPLIIMIAVPFVLVGVMWSVFLHGLPLSMFVAMGLVALIGIVVNDSIVMIDSLQRRRRSGDVLTFDLIIEVASSRLRAILLTTVTTVLGLFPTAYGLGGYDIFISPMCLAMAYGLLFGTTVVLFLVPTLYSFVMKGD